VAQRPGLRDRRQRLLTLTDKGQELERLLSENQRQLIAKAYRAAGAAAVEGFRKVMVGMIAEEDRKRFRPVGTPNIAVPSGRPAPTPLTRPVRVP
jgi:hypothetical protein